MVWPDGARFFGDFEDGLPNGSGEINWADGSTYKGNFVDSQPEGEGEKTWASGRKYKGLFMAGEIATFPREEVVTFVQDRAKPKIFTYWSSNSFTFYNGDLECSSCEYQIDSTDYIG